MNLCRADKVLLSGGAALLGSAALFGATPWSIGLPAAAFAALLADGIFRPSSGTLYRTICRGTSKHGQIALTFDDGPDAELTPVVLKTLAGYQARATFFVIGRHLARNASLASRMVAEGHELGNHSWSHSYFQNFYGLQRHQADIERSAALIRKICGTSTEPLYRPPVGLKSPALARVAHARRLTIVAWSVHARDTLARDPRATAQRVLARVRAGDIVLMHDGHDRDGRRRPIAAHALPLILRGLQQRGLKPVTVSQLLQDCS